MENKEGASNNTASFSLTQHEGSSLPPATGSEMKPPSPRPHGDLTGPSNLLPPPPPDHLVAPPGPENPNLVRMDQRIAVVALPVQKKRKERPRKNNHEGSLSANLPPMPISSSGPVLANFGFQPRGRGRGSVTASASASGGPNNDNRLRNPQMNRQMSELDPSPNAGEGPSMGFHVLTVNAGEDVMRKIMEIDQQVSQAIYISSAIGSISDVVLRQPMTPGGTVTYKGQFEILSLTGYFIPREDGGRGGGMSVSLARPDCSVFGGRLAGFLIAAGPVMVVIDNHGTPQEEDPNARYMLNKHVVLQPRPMSSSHGPSTETVHAYCPNDIMMDPSTSFPRVDEDEDFKPEDGEDEDEDEDEEHEDSESH